MPTYEYRCTKGHTFETIQRMADEPLTECEECGAPVERVFHPVAVHFKGSGFYSTDYGSKSKTGSGEGDSKGSGEGGSKNSDGGGKSSDSSASEGSSGGKGDNATKSSTGGD